MAAAIRFFYADKSQIVSFSRRLLVCFYPPGCAKLWITCGLCGKLMVKTSLYPVDNSWKTDHPFSSIIPLPLVFQQFAVADGRSGCCKCTIPSAIHRLWSADFSTVWISCYNYHIFFRIANPHPQHADGGDCYPILFLFLDRGDLLG